MRPQIQLTDADPRSVFCELALLVAEARVPDVGPRGRVEGPHYPVFGGVSNSGGGSAGGSKGDGSMSSADGHVCDQENTACAKAAKLTDEMQALWLRQIPVVIQVLLLPDQCCKAECLAHATLIERWYIEATPKRNTEDKILPCHFLIQAMRSYLHFSQLSAWLIASGGKTPENIIYRVCMPGEAECVLSGETFRKAMKTLEHHAFPIGLVGKCCAINVSVDACARSNMPPALSCACTNGSSSSSSSSESLDSIGRSATIADRKGSISKTSRFETAAENNSSTSIIGVTSTIDMPVASTSLQLKELIIPPPQQASSVVDASASCLLFERRCADAASSSNGSSPIDDGLLLPSPPSKKGNYSDEEKEYSTNEALKYGGFHAAALSPDDIRMSMDNYVRTPVKQLLQGNVAHVVGRVDLDNSRSVASHFTSFVPIHGATRASAGGNNAPANAEGATSECKASTSKQTSACNPLFRSDEPRALERRSPRNLRTPTKVNRSGRAILPASFYNCSTDTIITPDDADDAIASNNANATVRSFAPTSTSSPQSSSLAHAATADSGRAKFFIPDDTMSDESSSCFTSPNKSFDDSKCAAFFGDNLLMSLAREAEKQEKSRTSPTGSSFASNLLFTPNNALAADSSLSQTPPRRRIRSAKILLSAASNNETLDAVMTSISDFNPVRSVSPVAAVCSRGKPAMLAAFEASLIQTGIRASRTATAKHAAGSASPPRSSLGGSSLTQAETQCCGCCCQQDLASLRSSSMFSGISDSSGYETATVSSGACSHRGSLCSYSASTENCFSSAPHTYRSMDLGVISRDASGIMGVHDGSFLSGDSPSSSISETLSQWPLSHSVTPACLSCVPSISCCYSTSPRVAKATPATCKLAQASSGYAGQAKSYRPANANSEALESECIKCSNASAANRISTSISSSATIHCNTAKSSSQHAAPIIQDDIIAKTQNNATLGKPHLSGFDSSQLNHGAKLLERIQRKPSATSASRRPPNSSARFSADKTLNRFCDRTGLPLSSSPAPLKRNQHSFDFDASLSGVRAIKSALYNDYESGSSDSECGTSLCKSAPASTNLLGNFEESALTGRLKPYGSIDGFTVELGASGAFCPPHVTLPLTTFFFDISEDNAPSPYLGTCSLEPLGKKGYYLPRKGIVQVTLFNPQQTVVKMFVVRYDLTEMPAASQTFVRQRTFFMPVSASVQDALQNRSWLRYLIHLRFATSSSGKLYLHTDLRMLFSRKSELDANNIGFTDEENFELRSFTEIPRNPKYSPRKLSLYSYDSTEKDINV